MKFVSFEGNYRIYELTTGKIVVKTKDGNTVFIAVSVSQAKEWCKRH